MNSVLPTPGKPVMCIGMRACRPMNEIGELHGAAMNNVWVHTAHGESGMRVCPGVMG